MDAKAFAFAAPLVVAWLGCSSAPPPSADPPPPPPSDTPGGQAPPAPSEVAAAEAAAPKEPDAAAKPSESAPAPAAAVNEQKALGGALTQNEIREVVEKHGEYFNDCYTLGAGKSKQFIAKVTLKVTLGPSGSVSQALIANSTAKNPKVDQCVVDAFKKLKFPPPKSGATSVFTFPMEFKGAVETQ